MKRLVLLVALLGLGAAACGTNNSGSSTITSAGTKITTPASTTPPASTTTTIPIPAPRCSAAHLAATPIAQDLPQPVAAKRAAIVAAAVACDYKALAALTGDPFTYSFGGGDDAAGYWRGLEGSNDVTTKPLEAMVRLLNLRHGVNDAGSVTYYVWPAAFSYNSWDEVPEVDKEALRVLYGDKDFSSFAQFGGYIGYRVSITSKGDWNAFVAGD